METGRDGHVRGLVQDLIRNEATGSRSPPRVGEGSRETLGAVVLLTPALNATDSRRGLDHRFGHLQCREVVLVRGVITQPRPTKEGALILLQR